MVWNTATPSGSEAASNGDDRIRELKSDIQTSLRGDDAEGVEAIFPGSDTSNPVFRYRGIKGATGSRPAAGQYGLFFDSTRNVLQRDNGSAWEDVGSVIPQGTVMVFFQAAAPTGFTKLTAHNDKALRVVSATGGGNGGTVALSTSLAHSHTVNSHTHSITSGGSHNHGGLTGPAPVNNSDSGSGSPTSTSAHVHSISSDGSHDHGGATGSAAPGTDTQLAGGLAYIDVLICSKD